MRFEERTAGRAPLLSNPHMHFFEAALAWLDVAPD
ncbi:MAG: AGE family epimerase/isomerase [Methylocystis sp.]|nr:AGE family epimerase/isomerase [Methylocystis sp.]